MWIEFDYLSDHVFNWENVVFICYFSIGIHFNSRPPVFVLLGHVDWYEYAFIQLQR